MIIARGGYQKTLKNDLFTRVHLTKGPGCAYFKKYANSQTISKRLPKEPQEAREGSN